MWLHKFITAIRIKKSAAMVAEHIKLDFKHQAENVFTTEENFSRKNSFKVRKHLSFLFVLLIILPCIGISTYSIIMVKHLNREVHYLHEQIQTLKLSLVNNLVHDIRKFEHEDVYGKLINFTDDAPPLHEYDDYNTDDYYFQNFGTLVFKDSDEVQEEYPHMDEDIFKTQKKLPLQFLKVGDERKRMRRSYIDATTENIQINSQSNTNPTKKNMTTEKQKPLKLHKKVSNLRSSDLRAPEKRSSLSTIDSSKDKVSDRIRKRPQLKSGGHWESVEQQGTYSPDVTIVRDSNIHHRRNRHRQRNNIETFDEGVHPQRNKLLPSIHCDGDTSKYVIGRHTNYNGDGHLRHLNRRYVDWVSPMWVNNLGMNDHFTLNDGFLRIKETGLYFIYAQIFYLDEHDTNGYRVYKNLETLLQCTVTTHSTSRILKSNTCYTSGVAHLVDGDQISLQDLADGRYSLFEVGKSFFGVVKLGDIRNK